MIRSEATKPRANTLHMTRRLIRNSFILAYFVRGLEKRGPEGPVKISL